MVAFSGCIIILDLDDIMITRDILFHGNREKFLPPSLSLAVIFLVIV